MATISNNNYQQHYQYFSSLIGAHNILQSTQSLATDLEPFTLDSRGRYRANVPYILFPQTTEQVQEIMRYCYKHIIAVVPQGGNTGRCAGATPYDNANMVIINLSKMNTIIALEEQNNVMVVEAGVTLQHIIEKAEACNKIFPLAIGAAGSCMIGGNIATNAGGYNVLKYGNCRTLILGLEVVLPNGDILLLDNKLRKNNIGYDVKHLFIGAEGTLGIITKANIALFPKPKEHATYLLSMQSYEQGLEIFHAIQALCGPVISAFEVMEQTTLETLRLYDSAQNLVFEHIAPLSILCEVEIFEANKGMQDTIEALLCEYIEKDIIAEIYSATSAKDAAEFWALREKIVSAQQMLGYVIKFDIAVPLNKVGIFCTQAKAHLKAQFPDIVPYIFGHLGDGSLHFNLSLSHDAMDEEAFERYEQKIDTYIHNLCLQYEGTISAEHGIGRIKAGLLQDILPQTHYELLCHVKKAIDDRGIMNPGCIIAKHI